MQTVTESKVTTSILLPADLHAELRRQSVAEDRSMTALIRQALRAYLSSAGAGT
jgi:hypothetical protein